MTTRGSLARGQGQQQFQGNVQKWVRQWMEPGTGPGSSKVELLKWVPTGDRSGSKPGPRFPHLHPVSNANLKVPVGNKDNGKKPVPRQHEPMSSQPAAMEIDGGQGVLAIELQQEGTQSAAVNASRARESNGEVHSAPERPVKQGVTKLPDQEPPAATSQHAAGALPDQREIEPAPEVGRTLPDVAAEPIQTSKSNADVAPQRTAAPAVDLASHQAAPASTSDPENQQPAAELQAQQTTAHGCTQELQDATAAENGGNADEKLPLAASLGDKAPGQAPAGRDDKALTGRGATDQAPAGRDDAALTGQEAPDQAMTPEWDGTLAGDEVRSEGADGVLTGLGSPSGAPDQAPVSTAAETAASATALDGAVQLQQPAGGPLFGAHSADEQPQIHSEPAVAAAATPAKRPAEGVDEGNGPNAKHTKAEPGPGHS